MLAAALVLAANVFGVLPSDPPALPSATVKTALNPQYVRVSVFWADEQPAATSPVSFTKQADRFIAGVEAAGMRVLPTIYVGRAAWINGHDEPAGSHVSASFPPNDLDAYSAFLKTYIGHYAGHFDVIAIENEENSILYWGGSASKYVTLLKTAAAAIRSVDPKAKITDGGMVTSVWGTVIAKDWITTGARSRTDALNFAYGYFTDDQPPGVVPSQLSTPSGSTSMTRPRS
ncbi:MAG TPA: hypothetical protein VJZ76_19375 [Thermoanaerobaculia bacterium]|nr:hypothetical protein [Thermoanaerobaculia bacterium]